MPTSNNAKYLLVVSCYFTKWLQVIPLESIDAKTVATKLIERFISVLGVPVMLRGPILRVAYSKKCALY